MKKALVVLFILGLNKTFSQKIDTLKVYQNDELAFERIDYMAHRPCSKPKAATRYKQLNPKDSTYYIIYNDKKQLIKEGLFTIKYPDKEDEYKGAMYNSKSYYYKNNGDLVVIHYQEDGRNVKTAFYGSKNKLKKIRYIDKISATPTKDEIYKNNTLIETRYFISFYANKYNTVKEKKPWYFYQGFLILEVGIFTYKKRSKII